jgi:hypothetical protein
LIVLVGFQSRGRWGVIGNPPIAGHRKPPMAAGVYIKVMFLETFIDNTILHPFKKILATALIYYLP